MGPGGQAKNQNGNVWSILRVIKTEKKKKKKSQILYLRFLVEAKKSLVLLFWKQRNVFQAGTLQYLQNATCSSAICQVEGHGAKLSVQPACCQDGGQQGASGLSNRGDSRPGVADHETSAMTFPRDSCCPPDFLLRNTMSQEYGSPLTSLESSRDLAGLQPAFRAACQNTC